MRLCVLVNTTSPPLPPAQRPPLSHACEQGSGGVGMQAPVCLLPPPLPAFPPCLCVSLPPICHVCRLCRGRTIPASAQSGNTGNAGRCTKVCPPFLSSPPPLTRIGQRAQDPVPPHPVYGQRGTGRAGQSLSRPSPALMCTLAECRGGQGWGTASPLPAAGEPTDEEDCMRPCCCMAPIRWNNPPLSPCPSTVAPNGVWGVRPPFPTPRVCASRAQGWAGVGERRPCPLLLGGPQMRRTARAPIAMQHPSAGTPLPPSPPHACKQEGGGGAHMMRWGTREWEGGGTHGWEVGVRTRTGRGHACERGGGRAYTCAEGDAHTHEREGGSASPPPSPPHSCVLPPCHVHAPPVHMCVPPLLPTCPPSLFACMCCPSPSPPAPPQLCPTGYRVRGPTPHPPFLPLSHPCVCASRAQGWAGLGNDVAHRG
jgi:hypothetical protein